MIKERSTIDILNFLKNLMSLIRMKDVIDYKAMDYYQRRYRMTQENGAVI